jgi:hypothetical protein
VFITVSILLASGVEQWFRRADHPPSNRPAASLAFMSGRSDVGVFHVVELKSSATLSS